MALYGALAEHDRQGKELMIHEAALPADGSLEIDTDFAVIDGVYATVKQATAPTTTVLTYAVSGNTVTVYGWAATASGDTTLVASDGEETINVQIIGRRR